MLDYGTLSRLAPRSSRDLKTNIAPTLPQQPLLEKFRFNREAYSNLSAFDQMLFERFGQGTRVALPYEHIHHAFEAQAAAQPHALAADHLGDQISYGELERQANRLASILAAHGVQSGDHVSLFLRRSVPMLVGILAALKAGAAYVPQDAKISPASTLEHIINVTNSHVILTTSAYRHLIPHVVGTVVLAIDELMRLPFEDDAAFATPFEPLAPIHPDNTCYLLFTSGTTGTPNGVQVTHRNVCNILLTEPGNLGIRPGMKVGQLLNIAFDMAAWEILATLGNGGTLLIRGRDFMEVVSQVDVVIATPSILSSFDADQAHNVQVAAVAGEPCPVPLADKWSQFCTFYNSCGPTEVTIINTMQNYTATNDALSIGVPTPNNTVYVLNEKLEPCAIGEVGEMWAGGDCVSAGYLGNDTLNAERYKDDPFLGNGRKMFRTRDLGRWNAKGELEHYGRTDDQVKIRGFRVELDSVSGALESVPECEQAVTLKLDDRHLVAFVSPAIVDPDKAKTAVADALPYYCVPKYVFPLDELPRTSRGKVDKRGLLKTAVAYDHTNQAVTA